MRPVNKRDAPREYSDYRDARDDLADAIGWYCSYCEMPVKNMIEVEHVVPRHSGGASLEWENFLLSCKYCNTVKSDRNTSRNGYFWPDKDNTFLAFTYKQMYIIKPGEQLALHQVSVARNTIDLMGLDRYPGAENEPTKKDTRWRSRDETWAHAYRALDNWKRLSGPEMLLQIVDTALGKGHFSIWMEVFNNEPAVRKRLIASFKGTDADSFDIDGNPIPRSSETL